VIKKYSRRKVEIQAVQYQLDGSLIDLVSLAGACRTEFTKHWPAEGQMTLKFVVGGELKLLPGDWLVSVESGKLLHYTNEKFQQEFKEAK
jgi:hypothetical protein